MSNQLIGVVSGVAHFVLSLGLALLTTYGSYRLFDRLVPQVDAPGELKSGNTAIGILLASIFLSTAIIVKQVAFPSISTLQTALFHGLTWWGAAKVLAFIVGYLLLAFLIAAGSVWLALGAFVRMTRKIDELAEIRKNNVAVGIALGMAIVVIGVFLADGVGSVLDALIPFPSMGPVEVLGR